MTLAHAPVGAHRVALFALAGLTLFSATACQKTNPAPPAEPTVAVPGAAASTSGAPVAAPLAASEYFETLTEQAATATPGQLDTMIAQAKVAAARDSHLLQSRPAGELALYLQVIERARGSMARADLAIASIEAFRLFVSAGDGTAVVPVQVSLLDYAGFRYAVDVSATPIRWDDAVVAADYAAARWAEIEPRISDVGLRGRFGASVVGLKTAVHAHDSADAGRRAKAELDLVDELETYFATSAK
ncbi:hypothetical protein [uncultured Brevundimonas sp.]|uniref:hypothetical protein n=1 Tax=uncultured Brevundimonas sp. TaxID=213418 RepID=UPI0030EB93F1|tara:strand:- start:38295 stop:39029 length:735 start_codon:yes stop_codon:yes gene_type:complete